MFLSTWFQKATTMLVGLRIPAHISLALLLLWIVADGLFMDRSIEHTLLGHTVLMLLILLGAMLVETASFYCDCQAGAECIEPNCKDIE